MTFFKAPKENLDTNKTFGATDARISIKEFFVRISLII